MTLPHVVFTAGNRDFTKLADAVASVSRRPDSDTYAAHATWTLPWDFGATVYRDVRSRLVDDEDSQGFACTTMNDAPATLRAALEQAVLRAFGDAGRIAVMTGGGVDSGILLALAVHLGRRVGKEVFAVALDFAGDGDDRPYLVELERHLRCEVVRVRPEEGADFTSVLDGLDGYPSYIPTVTVEAAMLARAKAAGAQRVLSGAAGDQLFDGRARSLAKLVRRGRLVEALGRARALRGFGERRLFSWLVRPLLADLLPRKIRARRVVRRELPRWAGPALRDFERRRQQHYRSILEPTLPDVVPFERELFDAQHMQFARFRHQLTSFIGIPRADPYLAPTIVRTARSFPADWLLYGGVRRGLLRAAAADLIPRALADRVGKAAIAPALVRFVNTVGARRLLEPFADVVQLDRLGIVDAGRFRAEADEFIRDPERGRRWTTTWCVLSLERFLRANA